jgi:hypothetical protein
MQTAVVNQNAAQKIFSLEQLSFDLHDLQETILNQSISDIDLALKVKSTIESFSLELHTIHRIRESLNQGLLKERLMAKQNLFQGKRDLASNYLRLEAIVPHPHIGALIEIWPLAHRSPIHAHGGSVGVIKILYGKILMEFFAQLESKNKIEPTPFGEMIFHEGQATFLTSEINAIHRLNQIASDSDFSVSLQIYMRGKQKEFPYLDKNLQIQTVIPKTDLDYDDTRTLLSI